MISIHQDIKEKERSIKKLVALWIARQETAEKARLLMVKNPRLKLSKIKNGKTRG